MRAALVLAALLTTAACAAFDSDIPSRSCRRDADCFVAQGESCYLATGQCGPRPDAGPPDASGPDAEPSDAGDAGAPDAEVPDAESSAAGDAAPGAP